MIKILFIILMLACLFSLVGVNIQYKIDYSNQKEMCISEHPELEYRYHEAYFEGRVIYCNYIDSDFNSIKLKVIV